jgi:ribose 5-phosphate isomerase A
VDPEEAKRQVAREALRFVRSDEVLGVGAGSTVGVFIDALGASDVRPRAAVAASERTRELLERIGVTVIGLGADLIPLSVYIDGADEIDGELRLIKGGGGALAREKVIASASALFVCIAGEDKLVRGLGAFPLAVEVLPVAVHLAVRELRALGGTPAVRDGFQTDNGNLIVDVRGLDFADPAVLEGAIGAIPGVVECGIFARRRADVAIVGTEGGVRILGRPTDSPVL